MCRERDSNPHNHYWSRDFKSLVSTNSTIAAYLSLSKGLAKVVVIIEISKTFTLFKITFHEKTK